MSIRIFLGLLITCALGCASPYLKGVHPDGTKVYLGSTFIVETEAFQTFLSSPQKEANKIAYIFERLENAKGLIFYRDGIPYEPAEVKQGGKWLYKNQYREGQSAAEFIKENVWNSPSTGKPYYIATLDGNYHIGYYVLMNELELLEQTLRQS